MTYGNNLVRRALLLANSGKNPEIANIISLLWESARSRGELMNDMTPSLLSPF